MSNARAHIEVGIVDRATAKLRDINKAISNLAVNRGLRRIAEIGRNLREASGFDSVRDAAGGVRDGVGSLAGEMAKIGAIASVGGMAVGGFGFSVLRTGMQFDKFQAQLTTAYNSAAKGEEAMSWVEDFAAKTPYQLDQVTEAFVKLKGYGIDPMGGAMTAVGDQAAALGKDYIQGVEAIADAVMGENERLKEFAQISAKKEGAFTVYSYTDKQGKQQKARARSDDKRQIEATLLQVMRDKSAGGMDKLSQELEGKLSNIADAWTRFQKTIYTGGFKESVTKSIDWILQKIDVLTKNGALASFAKSIGDAFAKIVDGGFKWLVETFDAWDAQQKKLGGWEKLFEQWGEKAAFWIKAIAFALSVPLVASVITATASLYTLGAAMMATPFGWVVAAIAGVIAAGVALYMNWDNVVSWVGDLLGVFRGDFGATFDVLKALFLNFTPLGWMIQAFEPMKRYIAGVFDWVAERFSWLSDAIGGVFGAADKAGAMGGPSAQRFGTAREPAAPRAWASARPTVSAPPTVTKDAAVKVVFENMPSGAKAVPVKNDGVKLSVQQGYVFSHELN